MIRVSTDKYRYYIAWAKANTANTVYPCSIAEGFQSGDIFVDDSVDVKTVFFWHYCGFGYISGKPSEIFLSEIYEQMAAPQYNRRLVLITADEDVTAFFRSRGVIPDSRAEYVYRPDENANIVSADGCQNRVNIASADVYQNRVNIVSVDGCQNRVNITPSDRFQIRRIDQENIAKIEGRIIPSFSWASSEQFLKEGFGYIAQDQEKICAVSFSAAVSSDEIDIGVETHEDYRRMGLAAILANRMCEHIVSIGKKPVWAHSVSNTGSMNTALKCGFVRDRINTVIRQ